MNISTERARKWRIENPKKWKEHQLKYYLKKRKPCLECGKLKPFPKMGGKYCSKICSKIVRLRADRATRDKLLRELTDIKVSLGCSICGYNKCGAALNYHHTDDNK